MDIKVTVDAIKNAIILVEATLAHAQVKGTDLNKLDCQINYLKNILSYIQYEEELRVKSRYSKFNNIEICLN